MFATYKAVVNNKAEALIDSNGCILTRLMGKKHAMMWKIVSLLSESKLGQPLDLLPVHNTHTHTKTYNMHKFMLTDVQTRWDVKLSRILYKKNVEVPMPSSGISRNNRCLSNVSVADQSEDTTQYYWCAGKTWSIRLSRVKSFGQLTRSWFKTIVRKNNCVKLTSLALAALHLVCDVHVWDACHLFWGQWMTSLPTLRAGGGSQQQPGTAGRCPK